MTALNQPPAAEQQTILAARGVSKSYGEEPNRILVLDAIDLELRKGEFIALLGPSGSGKSTLLRILAGLIAPSRGEVLVYGAPLRGANPQVAIVFQSFALYPWLTVLDNVQLGLLAKDQSPTERREQATAAIDLIGLDGFEAAYPRELSGGMKQRVGFARALVVEPEVLFMDEPFSALDVLVAENLRHELLDLWLERKIPTSTILMVTHNIDEAVSMADRLLVFGANPGRVRVELPGLPLEQRRHKGPEHAQLVDLIYQIMTSPAEDAVRMAAAPAAAPQRAALRAYQALPHITIGDLTGFVERLHALGGREDLYKLEHDLRLEADDLLPLVEAADLLGFADIHEGDVLLTDPGRAFAEAGVLAEKEIFRHAAQQNIALIRHIVQALTESPEREIAEDALLAQLERSFGAEEARRQLDTAIDWGRYAELFAYDDHRGLLYLE